MYIIRSTKTNHPSCCLLATIEVVVVLIFPPRTKFLSACPAPVILALGADHVLTMGICHPVKYEEGTLKLAYQAEFLFVSFPHDRHATARTVRRVCETPDISLAFEKSFKYGSSPLDSSHLYVARGPL